jgi:CBS domain-containing protein
MTKSVADVMSADPRVIVRTAAVIEAAMIMLEEDVGSVPVVEEDGTLAGIVTDRDIALRVVAAGRDPGTTYVEDVATADPHCAELDESLDDAYERMAIWRIRRLPVVADNRVVGMLAQADLVHEMKDKKAGQLVEEISQPGQPSYGKQETIVS